MADVSECIQFRVGAVAVALTMNVCTESTLWPEISPIPLAPKALYGMFSLRGVTIPVVEIDGAVGNRDPESPRWVLMTKLGKQIVGIAGNDIRSVEFENSELSLHPERNVHPAFELISSSGVSILHPERLAAVIRQSIRFTL